MSTPKHGKFSTNNLDGYKKKNRFYLKDGSNIYRVLPPFGSLAAKGSIAQYWAVYWLTDTKNKPKPVPSIRQVGRDKQVLVQDPLFDKIESLKKALVAQQAAGANEAVLKALEERLKKLNLDKAYYINAINPAGEIGVLKLRYTAWNNLKEKLKKVEKDGIDAINVGTGIYFDFQRVTDDKGKVSYPVDVHTKTLKDQTTGKFKVEMVEATIDQAILDRMDAEAFELSTLFKTLSPEEQALAATLDPAVIDRLFARPERNEEAADEGTEEYDSGIAEDVTAQQVATAQAVNAAQTTAPATQGTSVNGSAAGQPKVAGPSVNGSAEVAGPKPTAAVGNTADINNMVANFLSTGKI